MSGSVQCVITRRAFDFSNLANATTMEVPLVRALEIAEATSIDLVVRVHNRNITGGSIQVIARAISLTSEEPETDFVSAGSDLAAITLNAASPVLHLASLSTPFGSMIRVLVKGTGATAATITATISVDIVVRDN